MNVNLTVEQIVGDPVATQFKSILESNEIEYKLENAELYYEFPIFKEMDGQIISSKMLLASQTHGVIIAWTSNATTPADFMGELPTIESKLEQAFTALYSRLIRNRTLRKSKNQLLFNLETIIFAPLIQNPPSIAEHESALLFTIHDLEEYLDKKSENPLDFIIFKELVATIEGAKGLIRPRERAVSNNDPDSKGNAAKTVESEIASFDLNQKHGSMVVLDGLQRIRGLAGSGKTVVLAMKAALTHLRDPDATIIYTFYTKSLYQLVQRLITRFYRQYDDKDPDWTKLRIMHAWGAPKFPGYITKHVSHTALGHWPSQRQFPKLNKILLSLHVPICCQKPVSNPFAIICLLTKVKISLPHLFDYASESQSVRGWFGHMMICRPFFKHQPRR